MADIAPAGWSSTFIPAEQSADDDLRQLKVWKAGEVDKSTWFEMRGRSLTLKAYWQQYDSIVIVNGVLHGHFKRGRALTDTRPMAMSTYFIFIFLFKR